MMLDTLKLRALGLLCRTLHLHTTEQVQDVAHAINQVWERKAEASAEEIAQLRSDLDRLQQSAVSEAVDAIACPRCGAPAGERCHDEGGKPTRRTHRERTAAWRARTPESASC